MFYLTLESFIVYFTIIVSFRNERAFPKQPMTETLLPPLPANADGELPARLVNVHGGLYCVNDLDGPIDEGRMNSEEDRYELVRRISSVAERTRELFVAPPMEINEKCSYFHLISDREDPNLIFDDDGRIHDRIQYFRDCVTALLVGRVFDQCVANATRSILAKGLKRVDYVLEAMTNLKCAFVSPQSAFADNQYDFYKNAGRKSRVLVGKGNFYRPWPDSRAYEKNAEGPLLVFHDTIDTTIETLVRGAVITENEEQWLGKQ